MGPPGTEAKAGAPKSLLVPLLSQIHASRFTRDPILAVVINFEDWYRIVSDPEAGRYIHCGVERKPAEIIGVKWFGTHGKTMVLTSREALYDMMSGHKIQPLFV